jgi:hypothetical protein
MGGKIFCGEATGENFLVRRITMAKKRRGKVNSQRRF